MSRLQILLKILIVLCAVATLVILFVFHSRVLSNVFLIFVAIFELIEWKIFKD